MERKGLLDRKRGRGKLRVEVRVREWGRVKKREWEM